VHDWPPEQDDTRPWDDQVPPGRDATLLAVVPIPGTGTSLAIVGYVIAASAASPSVATPSAAPPYAAVPAVSAVIPAAQAPEPASERTRRTSQSALRLDHLQRRVWVDGGEIQLTFQEFELLAFLTAHPATVFTRADLVGHVWHRNLGPDGRPVPRDSRTVDVHVSRVRRKLGPHYGQCLVTEYRVGYQFRPPPP
jgi:DNA-binding winged helix-turn-helix (wHTH) protein